MVMMKRQHWRAICTGSQAVVEAALAAADLAPMRSYLAMVRHQEFGIDPRAGAWLEERLVAARRADRDADPATFHSWLTVRATS